jgi:hypothetical protein
MYEDLYKIKARIFQCLVRQAVSTVNGRIPDRVSFAATWKQLETQDSNLKTKPR